MADPVLNAPADDAAAAAAAAAGAKPDAAAADAAAAAAAEAAKNDPAAAEAAAAAAEAAKAKDGDKADKGKAGAPEKYDIRVPDGVVLDEAAVTEFSAIAKEANLSNEQAQKLIDIQVKREKAAAEATQKAWTDMQDGWLKEAKADKDIGGAKFDETVGKANAFLKTFGTPGIQAVFELTGIDRHPEVLRMLAKAGAAISEDSLHAGAPAAGELSEKARLNRWFPTMAEQA